MDRLSVVAAVLAAALLAACSGSSDPSGTFSIRLELDMGAGSYCSSVDCSDYGMSCGARVAINIFDVERGAPVERKCEDVEPSDDLCGLDNIDEKTIYGIPPDRMLISVAAWRPGMLADGLCPVEDIFDGRGVPKPNFMPQPAFGGAIFFDVGSDQDTAVVKLSCPDPLQLDQPECRGGGVGTSRVLAQVSDIWTVLDVTDEQAAELDVGVASPRQVPGLPVTEYVIDNSATIDLERQEGTVPRFATELEDPLAGTVCTVVFDSSAAESTASVQCHEVDAEADPQEVPGILVPKERLDSIMTALALEDFPREGLVIGRVVDHTGAPLGGVSVTPDSGGIEEVQYLNADLTAVEGVLTSSSGFFVSRLAPFGTTWSAVHTVDGRRELTEVRAGLVRDKVTALIVRMQPP